MAFQKNTPLKERVGAETWRYSQMALMGTYPLVYLLIEAEECHSLMSVHSLLTRQARYHYYLSNVAVTLR